MKVVLLVAILAFVAGCSSSKVVRQDGNAVVTGECWSFDNPCK